MSTHTSLDAAATDRKARLAQLKSLKRKQPSSDEPSDATASTTEPSESISEQISAPQDKIATYLSGRNYDPELKAPKLGFESAPNANQSTLEVRAREIADTTAAAAAKDETEAEAGQGIDLFKLQPKKPNWDLKRDLAKKLEVLNVRTDNAIARLVRERIEGQKKVLRERQSASKDSEGGEEVGMKGEELVEALHQREREEAEDERRDAEDDEL